MLTLDDLLSVDARERINIDLPECDPEQRRLHTARYAFASKWVPKRRVLDVACGTGYGTAMLGSAGAESVTGVDLDPDTIEHARARFQFGAVAFAVGDAEQLRLDGPFDVVVSFETIEHLQRPERLLASVGRMLNVDGTFLVSTPCRESGSLDGAPQNPFHVREWNQVEFSAMLESAFRSVTLYGQLIEFAKNRLPFNRTLARLITSVVTPSRLRKMYSCDVVPLEGLALAGLRISHLVAVCREPRA